jgi:hypothetical protein
MNDAGLLAVILTGGGSLAAGRPLELSGWQRRGFLCRKKNGDPGVGSPFPVVIMS